MPTPYQRRLFAISLFVVALTVTGLAQEKPPAKKPAAGGPDKAYLQKIWDGWNALDASKQSGFYVQGKHMFFDVAPVKYTSWAEYEAGVAKEFADYKGAKFVVNDDAEIHTSGDHAWAAATVKADMTRKSGKVEMLTMRWTAIFQRENGKWLIVHEHVSAPMQ